MTPHRLSIRSSRLVVRNRGISIACLGSIIVTATSRNRKSLPGKRHFPKAYPIMQHTSTEKKVVSVEMSTLLSSHRQTG